MWHLAFPCKLRKLAFPDEELVSTEVPKMKGVMMPWISRVVDMFTSNACMLALRILHSFHTDTPSHDDWIVTNPSDRVGLRLAPVRDKARRFGVEHSSPVHWSCDRQHCGLLLHFHHTRTQERSYYISFNYRSQCFYLACCLRMYSRCREFFRIAGLEETFFPRKQLFAGFVVFLWELYR